MFIAYLVPKEDHHLIVEDGLAYLAVGQTQEEAVAKVRKLFDIGEEEDQERAAKAGYEPEPKMILEDVYAVHYNKV